MKRGMRSPDIIITHENIIRSQYYPARLLEFGLSTFHALKLPTNYRHSVNISLIHLQYERMLFARLIDSTFYKTKLSFPFTIGQRKQSSFHIILLHVCTQYSQLHINSILNCVDYTGGILQRLDTDVHSAVTAKTSTEL